MNGNTRLVWQTMRELIYKNAETKKVKFRNADLSEAEVSNLFNEHFLAAGAPLADATNVPSSTPWENYVTASNPNTIFLSPTDFSEVQDIIMSLKDGCASGTDEIRPKPLKAVSQIVSTPIAHICNLIMEKGVFPAKMKLARVTAIHKGGSFDDVNNYRPISVLSVFSKIAEHIINKRLVGFLTSQNIIVRQQFGFQKNKSPETALLGIKDEILHNIENKALTLGIFLDFRKAFDSVQHDILIKKLQHYGVRGIAGTLLMSYLTSREQYTVINGECSETNTLLYGVPQGSILGPVLFLIYINDIVNIPGASNLVLYADDTNVFFSGRDLDALFRKANNWMLGLTSWLGSNRLALNINKTKYVLFRSKGTEMYTIPCLKFNGLDIQQSSTTRFLGVTFHENLLWNAHIHTLRTDLSRALGILNRLRCYLPASIKRLVYYSLIHSRFSYCSLVWQTTTKTNLDSLLSIQKRAIRAISNLELSSSCAPYYRSHRILQMPQFYKYRLSLEVYRQYRLDKSTFETKYQEKRSVYDLRKSIIVKPRARTNYGHQRLSCQIADLLNNYPVIHDLLTENLSLSRFKKTLKGLFLTED